MNNKLQALKWKMDEWVAHFQSPAFLEHDPIQVPHRFRKKPDIEIMGFLTAMLAWGQRPVIIRKAQQLAQLMDGAPHDFVLHHRAADRKPLLQFRHRTFQAEDLLYFLDFLQYWYQRHDTLELAFARYLRAEEPHVGPALEGFHELFFSLPHAPQRTRKHVSTPRSGSACKRLNMFLRWMVRPADEGVDFGLWQRIRPDQLLIPLDVHVHRVASRLGLMQRKQPDWKAVLELTAALRQLDPTDPVKYDFALFGLGVLEKH